jgi:hypothetical protein
LELFSPGRLKATQIARKLVGVEDVPHRGLKPWKLGGKLRMLLCRISKVHELLPEQIVERALDTKSPFNAAGRPALLYPDLVKLYAAHAATITAGPSRAQKTLGSYFRVKGTGERASQGRKGPPLRAYQQKNKRARGKGHIDFSMWPLFMPATTYSPTHFRVQYNRPSGA